MEIPNFSYRPEGEPVTREIMLNPKDSARNRLLIDRLRPETDCEVSIGDFTIRIEPAGSAYRLKGNRQMGVIGPGQAFMLTQSVDGRSEERLLCSIENAEGGLHIEDRGSEVDTRVKFPYDVEFALDHAGVIRSPEDPDAMDELHFQLRDLAERNLGGYSDHAFARETYKERILEALTEHPVVLSASLFERLEREEVELEALSQDERRYAFGEAFEAVKQYCEQDLEEDYGC
ncbi:MAG: hypothetical protein Q8Q11_02630 [bacterium]|nr:hypothetical protein [bacterium]MDZ4247942.1 hypothetical protein [Patescibacteria group bacterium]